MRAGRALVDHLSHLRAPNGTGVGEQCCLPFQVILRSGEETRALTATFSGQEDAGWPTGTLNVPVSA